MILLYTLSPWLLSGSTPAKVFANIPPVWPPDDRWGVDSCVMYSVLYMNLIVKYNAIIIISSVGPTFDVLLLLTSPGNLVGMPTLGKREGKLDYIIACGC